MLHIIVEHHWFEPLLHIIVAHHCCKSMLHITDLNHCCTSLLYIIIIHYFCCVNHQHLYSVRCTPSLNIEHLVIIIIICTLYAIIIHHCTSCNNRSKLIKNIYKKIIRIVTDLANVMTEMIEKMISSPMKNSWIDVTTTSTQRTYVCQRRR